MCFTDCGASYLRGWTTSGGIQCEGYTYIMRRKDLLQKCSGINLYI